MKDGERKKLEDLHDFGVSCHRIGSELLRLARMLPYVGLKRLHDLSLRPLIYLALLFDKNPILTLAILPFIGLPVILTLIFVPLPGFIKAAVTVMAFIAFMLARGGN